jgi:subtilisin family serine protease
VKQGLYNNYELLKKYLHYFHPSQVNYRPRVGVADDVDCDCPDLGPTTCEALVDQQLATMESVQSNPELPFRLRPFQAMDHGTSVAGIIAARRMEFGDSGLAAPETRIVPIRPNAPGIVDDIQVAYANAVKLFNLSLAFGSEPPGLLDEVLHYGDALFVIAAGNDGNEICSGSATMLYPACWGDKPNVLVVAGTDLAGTSLFAQLDAETGKIVSSNWSTKYVAIAAPASGFYSSGRGRSYVPVIGTSFAVPLVASTAALLQMEGVINGPLIKQRLLATADFHSSLADKVGNAAFLNMRRALSSPGLAVLTDDNDVERPVDLVRSGNIEVRGTYTLITIPVARLRRATRAGDKYRFVYVDEHDDLKVIDGTAPGRKSWRFAYYDTDGSRQYADISDFKDFVGPVLE